MGPGDGGVVVGVRLDAAKLGVDSVAPGVDGGDGRSMLEMLAAAVVFWWRWCAQFRGLLGV